MFIEVRERERESKLLVSYFYYSVVFFVPSATPQTGKRPRYIDIEYEKKEKNE